MSSAPAVSCEQGLGRGGPGSSVEVPAGRRDGPVASADGRAAAAPAHPPVPGFVSPLLALVAALSILEGYIWLNVIAVDRWRPSTVAFAVVTWAVALVFVWPVQGAVGE